MGGQNDDPLNVPRDEAARERFRKIREELEAMQLPDLPGEEELRNRIPLTDETYSTERFPEAPQVTINKRNPTLHSGKDQDNARGLGVGITVAYTLVGAIAVGGLIGYSINHTIGVAFGALIGAAFGIGFMVYLINRP